MVGRQGTFSRTRGGARAAIAGVVLAVCCASLAGAQSSSDVYGTEGFPAIFLVTLSQSQDKDVTVNYTTVDGTAIAGQDYEARSGTVVIPAGQTQRSIEVPIIADGVAEPEETFSLQLSSPQNAALGQSSATVRISDPPVLSVGNAEALEGAGVTARVPVTLSRPSAQRVTATYTTNPGSAQAPGDYTSSQGTVSFQSGDTQAFIDIPIADDATNEPTEGFTVTLSAPEQARIGSATGFVTIFDNDPAPPPSGEQELPPPTIEQTANLYPESGRTSYTPPRSAGTSGGNSGGTEQDLRRPQQIQVGTIVDARFGKVRLETIDDKGVRQFSLFFEGVFKIVGQSANGLTTLQLIDPPEAVAAARRAKANGASTAAVRKIRRKLRRLWGQGRGRFRTRGGQGRGRFRTRGRHGAATVRGTKWLTIDTDDITRVAVREGSVTFQDFRKRRTVIVRAGEGYTARRPAR